MNIREKIRLLPIGEKAAILNELQEDVELNQYLSEMNNKIIEDETEAENDLTMEIDDEQILKYIKIVDERVANGTSQILSLEEVLKRLKAKRNAI